MNSECVRIADQLRRAFNGDAWHGPSMRELLTSVTPEQASSRPLPWAHSIWELVVHVEMDVSAAFEATGGKPLPRWDETESDWPPIEEINARAWMEATEKLFANVERLAHAVEEFTDQRLADTVPGREYDFYYLFHGIVQHSLYHGGQIAILKKAALQE